jgi:hypothetical protein
MDVSNEAIKQSMPPRQRAKLHLDNTNQFVYASNVTKISLALKPP